MLFRSLLLFLLVYSTASAQQPKTDTASTLFTAGFANAFIGGMYDGFYSYKDLKQHGNFGLGAPDKLDGELIILDGTIYQTRHNGTTSPVDESKLCPFATVNFFKPGMTFSISRETSKEQLLKYLDSLLNNRNGIYAIHLKGKFKTVSTRAFPPVSQKPYAPLASMLDKQHFFKFTAANGDLAGYRIPAFMQGANITGYHFHFLSSARDSGGHIIDFTAESVVVEIQQLQSFRVALPGTAEFAQFDFGKDRSEEVKSVESGKKAAD